MGGRGGGGRERQMRQMERRGLGGRGGGGCEDRKQDSVTESVKTDHLLCW